MNASFAADDPAYAIAALPDDATTLQAANPAHRLTTTFAPDGVAFTGKSGSRWSLHLSGIGNDAVAPAAPILAGNRIEYRRGNLTEWYINGPLGVEQGFTVVSRPVSGDALTLTLAVGEATPRLEGGDVTLAMPNGSALTYGHLLVTDATERQLPARLAVRGDAIEIQTDVAGAVYPVTVDPFVQQKKLIASDGAYLDAFGISVAMSSDGTKVIVGAQGKNSNQGAAYVYSGANYLTEKKLTASDGGGNFGSSVAMSADGTRVIVGAQGNPAAYVYSGANYVTEKKLIASDHGCCSGFGYAVAMSSDGTRVIVGDLNADKAYIYSGANYGTETKLTATDGVSGDRFGYAVAMSGDGAKVVVGAVRKNAGANTQQGAAYVYSGGGYATEKKLLASDGALGDAFDSSVAMSADGTKVVVGAYGKKIGANTNQGAAYVYSGATYGSEQRLVASDGTAGNTFGGAVAMSGDGAHVIVGVLGKHAAYVYSGATYATEAKLFGSDSQLDNYFAYAVAMSSDGTHVIVGAFLNLVGPVFGDKRGVAYVFAVPPNTLPPAKPPAPPSGSPGPAPAPKPGTGIGNPNPIPQPRP